jgi:ATP-binding cassette subfamily B protein
MIKANNQHGALILAVSLLFGVGLITQFHSTAERCLREYTAEQILLGFRAQLLLHAQRLSLLRHKAKGAADAIYRIETDAAGLQWLVIQSLSPLLSALLSLFGTLLVLTWINGPIAIVALAITPFLIGITAASYGWLRAKWHGASEYKWRSAAIIHETLGAVRLVKTFSREEAEYERYQATAKAAGRKHLDAVLAESILGSMIGLVIIIGTGFVLLLGVHAVAEQSLSVGELILALAYVTQLYQPLQSIGAHIALQQRALAQVNRALALFDEPPSPVERPGAIRLRRVRGEICFHHVSFRYPNRGETLTGIHFSVPAGARVCITGRTGAGKTTLLSLLMRLYEPTSGRILIDGIDIRDIALTDFRRQLPSCRRIPYSCQVQWPTTSHTHVLPRQWQRSSKLRVQPMRMALSPASQIDIRPCAVSMANSFLAASASGCRSHGSFSRMRRFSFSTNRPALSIG